MRRFTTALITAGLVLGVPHLAQAGWDEGIQAYQSGNYSTAAQEFQAFVQERDDFAGGHFMLGQALAKLNRSQEALNSFRKAYDLDPSNSQYQMTLAKTYLDVERYNDALALLEQINPSSLDASYRGAYQQMKTVALEKSGRGEQALQSLRELARQNPRDADIQYRFAATTFNAGNTAEAVTAFGRAIELNGNDTNRRAAYVKALIRQARENPQVKARAYQTAVTQGTTLVGQESSFDNLLLLGEAQLGAKQYAQAASSFERALAKKKDWLPYLYLSQAQTNLERYAAAEESLRQALALGPSANNERVIYKQIGFVNEKLRRYDEAKAAYNRAGDQASIARIEQNQQIAAENEAIEAENAEIEAMRREREALEREMEELEGPPPV